MKPRTRKVKFSRGASNSTYRSLNSNRQNDYVIVNLALKLPTQALASGVLAQSSAWTDFGRFSEYATIYQYFEPLRYQVKNVGYGQIATATSTCGVMGTLPIIQSLDGVPTGTATSDDILALEANTDVSLYVRSKTKVCRWQNRVEANLSTNNNGSDVAFRTFYASSLTSGTEQTGCTTIMCKIKFYQLKPITSIDLLNKSPLVGKCDREETSIDVIKYT
jgi:hypothetical protein